MPVKMRAFSSADLEHTEDKFLDGEFELDLARAGDDLLPIRFDQDQLLSLFGSGTAPDEEAAAPFSAEQASLTNKAVAIAVDLGKEDEETGEMPVLPENPTPGELIQFAENHPAVKSILRLFRGKVIDARRK